MPTWRVFVILFMALVCLTLGFATIVMPMTEGAGDYKWHAFAGLLVATGIMGFLLQLFLKASGRAMKW